MFVLGNFIYALAGVVDIVFVIAYWIFFVRVVMSWVSPDPFNPVVQFLLRATEPILQPIRRMLPRMRIDLSPLIVFIGLMFLRKFLVLTLVNLSETLKG